MELGRKKFLLKILIILFGLAILVVGITVGILYSNSSQNPQKTGTGAIASNGVECAQMGRKIFEMGGNVADVAVTTILCEGVSSPASCGTGGGFILTIYLKEQGIVRTLNARERAPRNATADMFVGNPGDSSRGGKAVAVPGDIKGIWELHQEYGSMKWKDLLLPIIDMCRNGHLVGRFLQNMLDSYEDEILAEPSLKEIFFNSETNKLYREGEKMKRPKLAETLEVIANEGIDALYEGGEIGKNLVADIQKYGGVMIEKDLRDYRAEWSDPVKTTISNNSTVYTSSLPSSGSMLLLMLNMLRNDNLSPNLVGYQRLIESMKYAFAHRTRMGTEINEEVLTVMRNLVDRNYADGLRALINDTATVNNARHYGAYYEDVDDRGTAHLSILAPNGDAISVTNTINDIFGAKFRSQSTGIILNDEMDDFSVPGVPSGDAPWPSPNNFAIPGNNPISSMIPTIIVDRNGDVSLVIGAAGGRRIITSVFYVLYRHIFFGETLEEAITAPRFHHQLSPMVLVYESAFNAEILKQLNENIGHSISSSSGIANVVAISVKNGEVKASFEPRRGGSFEVFEVKY